MSMMQMMLGASGVSMSSPDLDGFIKQYSGTGSTQVITTGMDLSSSSDGGFIWIKSTTSTEEHWAFDTLNGASYRRMISNAKGQVHDTNSLTSFNSTGFTVGSSDEVNDSSKTFTAYTFPKHENFFDVQTYNGNAGSQVFSHSLGQKPGMIWVKSTPAYGNNEESQYWMVWHKALDTPNYWLNLSDPGTAAQMDRMNDEHTADDDFPFQVDNGYPTDTQWAVHFQTMMNAYNQTTNGWHWPYGSGGYVPYTAFLFAEEGPGIKCGSYTGNTTSQTISTGFKPQWLMVKALDSTGDWFIIDKEIGVSNYLKANDDSTSASNSIGSGEFSFVSGGFSLNSSTFLNAAEDYMYMAIGE